MGSRIETLVERVEQCCARAFSFCWKRSCVELNRCWVGRGRRSTGRWQRGLNHRCLNLEAENSRAEFRNVSTFNATILYPRAHE